MVRMVLIDRFSADWLGNMRQAGIFEERLKQADRALETQT